VYLSFGLPPAGGGKGWSKLARNAAVPHPKASGRRLLSEAPYDDRIERRARDELRGTPAVTESKNAVFLSYAAQDADAAQRLCEALRVAGIEVWLDRSELRGGDVWDQRIRREIRDCALFIPIISANTQARLEGYFRREWKLAVARTLDMADDKPFLVPVVIDLTNDADARVPEKFREVQWTLLPDGATPPYFLERLQRLLAPAEVHTSTAVIAASSGHPAHSAHPLAAAQLPIPEKSIAVLPFADMSAQKDQEYFSDGLAEALIDLLTQVRDLRVPARTSSFSFKGKSDDIASIAEKLRVAHVLEGSVRKAGNMMRVTVHLIRADDGYHLWSKTYDRDIEDIFKVQDEIAGIVVEALIARMRPSQGMVNPHRTANLEAYEQYLLGKHFHYYRRGDSAQRALAALRNALSLDPNYASAHALLAISMADQIMVGTAPFHANAPLAIEAAEKAVALAPSFGEAYSARSFVRSTLQWDWIGAQADIEMALQLDPRSETTQRRLGVLLASTGRIPQALAAAKVATEIEPLDVTSWSLLGLCYCAAGQFDDGKHALRRGLGLSPGSIMITLYLSLAELATGQTIEALETNSRQQYEPWRWIVLAAAEYVLGHAQESQRVMDEMIAKYGQRTPYAIAIAYVWRGQMDNAFEWLERAYQQRDAAIAQIQAIFGLSEVRKDPRYQELLGKMNFPE
jgi:TolB-like protein/Tfp pilus assembly protein PilF